MVASHRSPERPGILAACAVLLALATGVAYRSLLRNGFVYWDDPLYVSGNQHVRAGLSLAGVGWAFRTLAGGNWHPLTWLSHMLDCQLFGLDSAYHHLNNLLLHAANSVLLLLVLWRMTRCLPRSLLVATLFALHPLHVESVAWASERKDLLSTCFGLLALLAYERYARQPTIGRYLPVALAFILSLLCKPMLVTLPLLLLLLDGWPLGRLTLRRPVLIRLMGEKLPLLFLALLSCLVTIMAQSRQGALETLPLLSRIENAVVAYAFYLWKMIWPVGLAFLYPRPDSWPPAILLASAAVLVLCTALALASVHRCPAILVGWLWYLGTAVPIIGLVQVGMQFAADRYTYFPLIGIFVALCWALPPAWLSVTQPRRLRSGAAPLALVLLTALTVLAVLSRRQVTYWHDSVSLFQRAITVTRDNEMAHFFLAEYLAGQGRAGEAAPHYAEAERIKRERARPYVEQAVQQARQLGFEQGMAHFLAELRLHPQASRTNLAVRAFLRQSGKPDRELSRPIYQVATVLDSAGNLPEAIGYYREAVRLDPEFARAQNDLGAALASYGELGTAIVHLSEALRLRPDSRTARDNLIMALARYRQEGESKSPYPASLRQVPDLPQAEARVAEALRRAGQVAEAQVHDEAARRGSEGPPAMLSPPH